MLPAFPAAAPTSSSEAAASLAMAEKAGLTGETEEGLRKLVSELNALEPRLKAAVEDALADTEGLARKLAAAKGKSGRYRSGATQAPHFARTV